MTIRVIVRENSEDNNATMVYIIEESSDDYAEFVVKNYSKKTLLIQNYCQKNGLIDYQIELEPKSEQKTWFFTDRSVKDKQVQVKLKDDEWKVGLTSLDKISDNKHNLFLIGD